MYTELLFYSDQVLAESYVFFTSGYALRFISEGPTFYNFHIYYINVLIGVIKYWIQTHRQ